MWVVLGQTFAGKGLAFSGLVGLCVAMYSFHAVEHPREVWAAWRAFFFLVQKKLVFVPDSEAFNSFIGDGSRVLVRLLMAIRQTTCVVWHWIA